MRDRAIDQFESIFEGAAIPVLDIQRVRLDQISAVITGDALDDSIIRLAAYLKTRFAADVTLLAASAVGPEDAKRIAERNGFVLAEGAFHDTIELVGRVAVEGTDLVLLGEADPKSAGPVNEDKLVKGTTPPVLLTRTPIDDPKAVFSKILHSLSGNFQQTVNFSYSFTLAETGGHLRLFHAIDPEDIDALRDALRFAQDVAPESEKDLLERLAHHGERYLKGVAAAAQDSAYEVDYRLRIGDVVASVQAELAATEYGLLVVGHHVRGRSRITAGDYQLMHLVRDVPVLAL